VSRAASLQRLHGLVRAVNGDLDLDRTLQSVCQGVVDGLGFDVAVMNLVVPGGDLEVVACAGDEDARAALLGTRAGRATWDRIMQACRPVGELLVDYAHVTEDDDDLTFWVPSYAARDDPDAWHPQDVLFAPLRTARSGLVGVVSVDSPRDGRRPGPGPLQLLEMYAAQASVAIENAQLHTALLTQHDERAETLGRLTSLVSHTPMGIVELDLEGRVRSWNPAATRIFGWTEQEVLGRHNPVVSEDEYEASLQELVRGPQRRAQVRRARRDGSLVDVEMSAEVLRDTDGRGFGYLGVYVDITDRVLLEEELRTAAYTDVLTGLANRARFTTRLETAAASPGGATVLLLDLDGFKAVNDTAGHAGGDRVLVEVARRIVRACRTGDLVARLGGDEFVVLLEGPRPAGRGADRSHAERLAARLVATLARPVRVGARTLSLGASVGVARLAGPGNADDLLRDADVAMYAAKAQGKGRYRVFEPRLREDLVERADLVRDLRRALDGDELRVRWQPVVRVADARLLGLEALLHRQHPVRGELPLAGAVPVEEAGLVVALGQELLHRACTALRGWQCSLPRQAPRTIGVGLSPVQVRSRGLVQSVRDVLADTGVAPSGLLLRLTEDVLLEDGDAATDVLQDLRGLGVRLAVDGFGAGGSSLSWLRRLPVDVVVLDRSLLEGVETDRGALALLDAVVAMVGRLGLVAVADGVETPGQWSVLERVGCPGAQGPLLAPPLRETDVPRLLCVGWPSSGTRPPG
jgi:diguanylate cyclase (GGDEF)-like protein/PAS domain S-box-containing protein